MCNTSYLERLTANCGVAVISTANPNRDGTGSITNIITARVNGTEISNLTIKAQQTTSPGMIRLFVHDGTNYFLVEEIPIPGISVTAQLENTFKASVQLDLSLKSGWSLAASTEKAEPFNVFARGDDWEYCDCPTTT